MKALCFVLIVITVCLSTALQLHHWTGTVALWQHGPVYGPYMVAVSRGGEMVGVYYVWSFSELWDSEFWDQP